MTKPLSKKRAAERLLRSARLLDSALDTKNIIAIAIAQQKFAIAAKADREARK